MKGKMLFAALAAALVAGVAATATRAVPDPGLKITPTTQLQFGTVPIGVMSDVKPVVILNRTTEWMYYGYADWPGATDAWPYGIWERDPADPYAGGSQPWYSSGCDYIAPKSSCTLYFAFDPSEAGLVTESFSIAYYGWDTGNTYESNVITMLGTGA